MGAAIEAVHPQATIDLKPGGRGDFIVIADDREVWNKRQMGDEFPAHDVVLERLTASAD